MSLRIAKILGCLRHAGPYLAIELILPGGSVIALLLWLLRNRATARRALARVRCRGADASQLVAALGPSTAATL